MKFIFKKENKIGPVDLLIIQGTPFCNINCTYCYLPERSNTQRISIQTIRTLFERLLESDLLFEEFTIVWHAGEPLTIPLSYYIEIFETINSFLPPSVKAFHSFQTNGMLINQEWCKVIKDYDIKIGVSIDGPEFIHNKFRTKRNGAGTFGEVMRGIQMLRSEQIDFHVISVVTDFSLDYPDEMFNFFSDLNIQRVGFNIEEVEGLNEASTINDKSSDRVSQFLERILELQKLSSGRFILREFESAFRKVIGNPTTFDNSIYKTIPESHLLNTYGIISVDCNGNFMTFSPELLGQKSKEYDDFILGNIASDSFRDALKSEKFKRMNADIREGIRMCKQSCEYFKVCGGGAPSNKYYENGTFKSTETLYCKYSIKLPIDIILSDLEKTSLRKL